MNMRTDLVSELRENSAVKIPFSEEKIGKISVEWSEINDEKSARIIEKPIGKYCTVKLGRIDRLTEIKDAKSAIVASLERLLPENRESVMVVGLGNSDITPDALGPFTANKILATRHIDTELKKRLSLERLKSVSVMIPGVLGKTGMEASETVAAAVKAVKPTALIVIDALAAYRPQSLCSTVQLTDSGICPGSGVHNARKAFNSSVFKIPVIAIGIPTVIDSSAYNRNLNDNSEFDGMMVTPKEIDLLINDASGLLASSINRFLQPFLDDTEIDALT